MTSTTADRWRSGRAPGRLAIAAVALACLASCARPEPVSNTGYVGTWSLGTDWRESVVEIVEDGDGYRFRFRVRSADGKNVVVCDWDGRCEETVEGRRVSTFALRSWVDPATGHLMVESTREILTPPERVEVQVDEFVVEDEGLALRAYKRERAGQTFEGYDGPNRRYEKVSDRVSDPPEAAAP